MSPLNSGLDGRAALIALYSPVLRSARNEMTARHPRHQIDIAFRLLKLLSTSPTVVVAPAARARGLGLRPPSPSSPPPLLVGDVWLALGGARENKHAESVESTHPTEVVASSPSPPRV